MKTLDKREEDEKGINQNKYDIISSFGHRVMLELILTKVYI